MPDVKAKHAKDAAFREVLATPPERVKQTKRTRGEAAAKRQMTAIALEKARRRSRRM